MFIFCFCSRPTLFNIVSKNDLGRLYFYRDFYLYCSRPIQHQYYCIVIVYYCFLLWCWMNIKVEKLKLKVERYEQISSGTFFMAQLSKKLSWFNPLESRGNSATSNNTRLLQWPLMGGLLHLVQRGGACSPPRPYQM